MKNFGDYSEQPFQSEQDCGQVHGTSMTDKARDIYDYLSDYDSQDVDDLKECDFVDAYDKYNDGEYADAKERI